jgi:hypothetical protein
MFAKRVKCFAEILNDKLSDLHNYICFVDFDERLQKLFARKFRRRYSGELTNDSLIVGTPGTPQYRYQNIRYVHVRNR